MDIWHDLALFIDGDLEESLSGYLIFSIASAIFGLIIILVDWSYYTIKRKSLVDDTLKYYPNKIPYILLAYVIGAGGVGFISVILNILNFHIHGAVSAGIAWPFILSKIFAAAEGSVEEEKRMKEEE